MKVYLRHVNEAEGHYVDDLSIDELIEFRELVKERDKDMPQYFAQSSGIAEDGKFYWEIIVE